MTRVPITAKDLAGIIAYKANLKLDAHQLCIWYVPYITTLLRSYSAAAQQQMFRTSESTVKSTLIGQFVLIFLEIERVRVLSQKGYLNKT